MALRLRCAAVVLSYWGGWLVSLVYWGWCNWGEISRVFDGVFKEGRVNFGR